jgi:hypothetical protein
MFSADFEDHPRDPRDPRAGNLRDHHYSDLFSTDEGRTYNRPEAGLTRIIQGNQARYRPFIFTVILAMVLIAG